jgi:hypothetical protein
MFWDFDKIPKYVINLDKRTDRWKHFESQPGLPDFHNIRRYSAVDGNALNIYVLAFPFAIGKSKFPIITLSACYYYKSISTATTSRSRWVSVRSCSTATSKYSIPS